MLIVGLRSHCTGYCFILKKVQYPLNTVITIYGLLYRESREIVWRIYLAVNSHKIFQNLQPIPFSSSCLGCPLPRNNLQIQQSWLYLYNFLATGSSKWPERKPQIPYMVQISGAPPSEYHCYDSRAIWWIGAHIGKHFIQSRSQSTLGTPRPFSRQTSLGCSSNYKMAPSI